MAGRESARADEMAVPLDLLLTTSATGVARRMMPDASWSRFGLSLASQPSSPLRCSTRTDSPVSADSSKTAASEINRPSTGKTSPEPTTSWSPTTTASAGTTSTPSRTRRRAARGARFSSERRSFVARRSAACSSACPVASMTTTSAPARYSPTASVPINDNTAMTSTPTRPWRNPLITDQVAGPIAMTVAVIQHVSATWCAPRSHAATPASKAPTATPAAPVGRRAGVLLSQARFRAGHTEQHGATVR
jgi:hypothetical protein